MKKRKILAIVLACATILSLVGCGNTATVNETEKDTTVTSESEVETETVDHNAWCNMTVTIEGADITMGDTLITPTYEESFPVFAMPLTTLNESDANEEDTNPYKPNKYGISELGSNLVLPTRVAFPVSVNKISVYFPTTETKPEESRMWKYDFALALEKIYAANKGELELPEVVLANELKIGTRVAGDGYEELKALYGEPTETYNTEGDYSYGTAFVWETEDGSKSLTVYTASNYVIGFKLFIDCKVQEWYNH